MHHNANRKKKKKKNWACAFFCLLAGFLSFGVMGHCWCIMHLMHIMHIMHIILGNGINSVNVVNVVNVIIFDTSSNLNISAPISQYLYGSTLSNFYYIWVTFILSFFSDSISDFQYRWPRGWRSPCPDSDFEPTPTEPLYITLNYPNKLVETPTPPCQ